MLATLVVLFLVVPFVELFLIIQVGQAIGAVPTIGILILVSIVGAWLVKREGLEVLSRARVRMHAGEVPGSEIIDGVLILFAGALLVTPGFVTDLCGILLLLPPVRAGMRRGATRALRRRSIRRVQRW